MGENQKIFTDTISKFSKNKNAFPGPNSTNIYSSFENRIHLKGVTVYLVWGHLRVFGRHWKNIEWREVGRVNSSKWSVWRFRGKIVVCSGMVVRNSLLGTVLQNRCQTTDDKKSCWNWSTWGSRSTCKHLPFLEVIYKAAL